LSKATSSSFQIRLPEYAWFLETVEGLRQQLTVGVFLSPPSDLHLIIFSFVLERRANAFVDLESI
jgi:hypothetical protein